MPGTVDLDEVEGSTGRIDPGVGSRQQARDHDHQARAGRAARRNPVRVTHEPDRRRPARRIRRCEPAQDFYRLRREGIGFIEQMGSREWTDYNVHDPGITILEALVLRDHRSRLSHRLGHQGHPVARRLPRPIRRSPIRNQAFFTAREILTVNPTTSDDFRRLLIDLAERSQRLGDLQGVRVRRQLFRLVRQTGRVDAGLRRRRPNVTPAPQEVWARGLYEALLELEADPELGDLNDRKIESQVRLPRRRRRASHHHGAAVPGYLAVEPRSVAAVPGERRRVCRRRGVQSRR